MARPPKAPKAPKAPRKPREPAKPKPQCHAVGCDTLCVSAAFYFCLPHWRRLRAMADEDPAISLRLLREPAARALVIRALTAILAQDEGKVFDEEPIT